MTIINKQDTDGTKGVLGKGELGFDDYSAGGDQGRMYIGDGANNIPLSKKQELDDEVTNRKARDQYSFKVAQAVNKEIYDRSGFIVFDEGSNSTAGDFRIGFVNDGLVARNGAAYETWMANKIGHRNGSVNINGTTIKGLWGFDSNYYSTAEANIYVPDAPRVTHADSTKSGLVLNGDFSLGNNGNWLLNSADITAVYTGTSVQLSQITSDNFIYTSFSTEIGKTYALEFDTLITSTDDGWSGVFIGNAFNSPELIDTRINTGGNGLYKQKIEFTATATTSYLTYHLGTVATMVELFNFAVYPKASVERTDLIFLEVWHEDTSEKGFVYPYGNTQYGEGDVDGLTGIINGDFIGFDTYSLFGDWQASSAVIGKGYKLSNLTESQLAVFISNPEHNCYYTNDGKLIQIRYRIRTIDGFGDDWRSIDASSSIDGIYTNLHYAPTIKVQAQGSSVTSVGLGNIADTLAFWAESATGIATVETDEGVFSTSTSFPYAYGSKCYALPIATIKRLNQGGYHPLYNDRGSREFSNAAQTASTDWYNPLFNVPTTTIDCFDIGTVAGGATVAQSSGYIGTISGRPDSKFYDAIYAEQLVDLRLLVYKNWTAENTLTHLVHGSARGVEGDYVLNELPALPYLRYTDTNYAGTVVSRTNGYNSGEMLHCDIIGDPVFYPKTTIDYTTTGASQVVSVVAGDKVWLQVLGSATGTVGNYYVAKVAQASIDLNTQDFTNTTNWINTGATNTTSWQEELGQGYSLFGTPLLVGENGENYIPDSTGKVYKLSKKVKSIVHVVVSDNTGMSWTMISNPETIWSWNSTTNSYTPFSPTGRVGLIFYTTYPEPVEPVVNTVIADKEIGQVWAGTSAYPTIGLRLIQSLIGKVGVSSTSKYVEFNVSNIRGYLDAGNGTINAHASYKPKHDTVDLAASNPAVKLVPYKTADGVNFIFKELYHNGTSWGDHDNTFTIVDNVSTEVDGNGQTILIGQKKVKLKSDLR